MADKKRVAPGVDRKGDVYTIFAYYRNDAGRRKVEQRTLPVGTDRRSAIQQRAGLVAALGTQDFVPASRMTVKAFLMDVWLPAIKPSVDPVTGMNIGQIEMSTWQSYEKLARLHVVPHIGDSLAQKVTHHSLNDLYKRVRSSSPEQAASKRNPLVRAFILGRDATGITRDAIAAEVVERFPEEAGITRHAVARIIARERHDRAKEKEGHSKATVELVRNMLRSAYRWGVLEGMVPYNPVPDSTVPKQITMAEVALSESSRQPWDAEHYAAFFNWLLSIGHRLATALIFVSTSADRRGMNLGLAWDRVDLDAGTAILSTQVVAENHLIVVKPYGKSGAGHVIQLDEMTNGLMRSWRRAQARERLAFGKVHTCGSIAPDCPLEGYHDRGLAFTARDGNYLHPERFSREFADRLIARYNREHPEAPIPRITVHTLRAGWATFGKDVGVSDELRKGRLDHANMTTTHLYTRPSVNQEREAAEKVAKAMFGGLNLPQE